jgi:protoheme IX farnesyltransferase
MQARTEQSDSVDVVSPVRDYISLLKPRVMTLVVFTGIIGLLLAPGEIHPFIACIAILAIALGSGASGAINMWYERELDAKMTRTARRPLPAGRLDSASALEFAVLVALFSVVLMTIAVNIVAAATLLAAILFYVFIYTIWLKPRTPQNIVIGGAAGAFPPVIGWSAVTGDVALESWVLFAIIFFWTPPHFWALALYKSDDYKRANIPMLPVVSGRRVTQINILIYTVILWAVTVIPYAMGLLGVLYFVGAVLLGAIFFYYALRLYRGYTESLAKKTFGYSIFYLFLLFLLMVIDRMVYAV